MPTDLRLPHCLSCRERLPRRRGLCDACYYRLRVAVHAGETTWAALEAEGLALPTRPTGGPGWRWSRRPPG
jgi:hypothetical protein